MSERSRELVKDTYSNTAESYDRIRETDPHGRLISDHDIHLFESIFPKSQGNMDVLELGAGTGRFTLPVLERGFEITTTDVNESMIEAIQKKVADKGWEDKCHAQTADIFNLSFDDSSFDYIFTIHVIPRFTTLQDQVAAIHEIGRVLKPGGRVLFNYSNKCSLFGLFNKRFTTKPSEIKLALRDAKLHIVTKRGKWLLNRSVVNRLPLFVSHIVARIDRCLFRFFPNLSWDVFIVAEKE